MQWFDAKTNPPAKEGYYLCASRGDKRSYHYILGYSKNLESVDDLDFHGVKRPGWYEYDSEYGYYEIPDVDYWMPLPEVPYEPKGE